MISCVLVEVFLTEEAVNLKVVAQLLLDVHAGIKVLLLDVLMTDRIATTLVGIALARILGFAVDVVVVQVAADVELQLVGGIDSQVHGRTNGRLNLTVVVLIDAPPQTSSGNRTIQVAVSSISNTTVVALIHVLVFVDVVLTLETTVDKVFTDVQRRIARCRLYEVDGEVHRHVLRDAL